MEKILSEIQDGEFTKEWEKKITKLKFKIIKYFVTKQKINKIENLVRKNLKLKLFDIYEEEPPTETEFNELEKISGELKLFEEYYE
jgi:ketol-acid reductoisomerase